MKNSDRAWQIWGEKDPYFGVVSHEEFSGGNNKDKFFALGREWADDVLAKFEKTFGTIEKKRALDFGCGVGRLSLAFANHFDEVVGVDVSPAMLKEAAANAVSLNKTNTKFVASDDDLSRATGQFAFVNTYIVLQHIPVDRGMKIFRQLVDRIAPGGGCNIHVSIKRDVSSARRLAYWVRMNVPGMTKVSNMITGFNPRGPAMQMNEYPIHQLIRVFHDAGMIDLLVSIEDHSGVLTLSFMGRRPTTGG